MLLETVILYRTSPLTWKLISPGTSALKKYGMRNLAAKFVFMYTPGTPNVIISSLLITGGPVSVKSNKSPCLNMVFAALKDALKLMDVANSAS